MKNTKNNSTNRTGAGRVGVKSSVLTLPRPSLPLGCLARPYSLLLLPTLSLPSRIRGTIHHRSSFVPFTCRPKRHVRSHHSGDDKPIMSSSQFGLRIFMAEMFKLAHPKPNPIPSHAEHPLEKGVRSVPSAICVLGNRTSVCGAELDKLALRGPYQHMRSSHLPKIRVL